ncbi:F-box only protein 21 isoform X1 [Maniola hyperantus]|uniref:F-box only protein 21 isoform X1 n=1 Tax=Aphantopus hyperantus TaxID=2795564 RepID=UPI00156854DD|nr:F-box only protein 21-like [Maniola hyperantus]
MNQDTRTSIINLPDEIITLILVNSKPRDIMHFGATCKQFLELVSNNDYLWKIKYSETVPSAVVSLVSERNDGNWLRELIQFYRLKQTVCMELISMPPEYHWRVREVSLTDVAIFFTIATENNLNYYYTIYILQDIVKKGNTIIDSKQCLKPLYTLTTIYYAKIVLRYLLHTYLAMKWLQKHIRIELTPVFVTTFFLQWIDVTKIYSDEDVEQRIQLLVTKVQDILKEPNSKLKSTQQFERNKYTEKQVLHAITKVIYNNNQVSASPGSKTLDIVKVIDENDGNVISYGAIYQAVAKRFGLKCELIAFPNHLFLEWQSSDEPNQLYTIELFNGEVKPKRRCPFSQGPERNYEYCPDSLLQFIYSSYMKSKGPIKNCKTQNAIHLWDFFGTNHNEHSPYKNFFLHLVKYAHSPAIETTLNIRYLEDVHLEMVLALSRLNEFPEAVNRKIVIKRRHKAIKYGVGMICYHNIYNYICVIRGWEVDGSQLSIQGVDDLRGKDQPFYRVTAGDQSERFVAQENLKVVYAPFRIQNLEDCIAREFTHFDGFSYVPNDEKLLEYPDEEQYIEAFKKSAINLG